MSSIFNRAEIGDSGLQCVTIVVKFHTLSLELLTQFGLFSQGRRQLLLNVIELFLLLLQLVLIHCQLYPILS